MVANPIRGFNTGKYDNVCWPHLIVGADINNGGDGEENKRDTNIERTLAGKSSAAQQSRRD
jgi:hypothetical protein